MGSLLRFRRYIPEGSVRYKARDGKLGPGFDNV